MRDTYQDELDCADKESVTDSESSDNESDNSNEEVVACSESLALMSVKPVVNVVAFDDRGPIRIYTNINLIEKLGLESMVKQLLFSEHRYQNHINGVDPLKCFMPFLQVLVDGLPEEIKLTKPFAEWHELEHTNVEPSARMKDQCHDASFEAAHVLINRYPNVSSISATMVKPHEFMQKLILDLAVGYDKQLSKFVYDMPATHSYTLTAPNLIELDLTLRFSRDQNLPTICPGSLQKINLVLDRQLFSWNMFRIGNKPKPIVFNNLEDLSITYVVQNEIADDMLNANNIELVFPSLERLYLENCTLARKNAQAMMSHGLKELHFEGSIVAASELCEQPLRNLDRLDVIWVERHYREEADNFVTLANEIFNKTDGIEHVYCKMRSMRYTERMNDVDWPYLTHLSLGFMIPFKELFVMLPKVPNLVCLDMNICQWGESKITEATELLTNIKKHYPTPLPSKIKTLRLVDNYGVMLPKLYHELPFVRAIENLKWYLPQLTDIDIQGEDDEL
ncbi:hypothetical protein GGH15_003589 [Coemansia sp. RSA 562]|nr:hypothetical protein GGH15_003589 [Coemansia sp. RSA 562]